MEGWVGLGGREGRHFMDTSYGYTLPIYTDQLLQSNLNDKDY